MNIAGGTVSPLDYHHATKHAFGRFARSLGYLDWASQPDPFRRFPGAAVLPLSRAAPVSNVPYSALYSGRVQPQPVSFETIGEFLRCSLGVSAWKAYGSSRWALRVNPSSGNLHPTEGYIVWNGRVCHYAPAEHALEERAVLPQEPSSDAPRAAGADSFLVGLTSIHWREAWKYGERAFRYCQHDVGHALGALRLAAAMLGWQVRLLPSWSHAETSALLGIDRDEDFGDAEREEPDAIAVVSAGPIVDLSLLAPSRFVEGARAARWRGRANRLSPTRVDWPVIEEVAAATAYPGSEGGGALPRSAGDEPGVALPLARQVILQRRSATGFDPRGVLGRDTFVSMLARLVPPAPPWDLQSWSPQVHLVLFVHRVQGMAPGIYAFLRTDEAVVDEWRGMMRQDFLWDRVQDADTGAGRGGLFLLAPLDVRDTANRLSCDQDIASDGFFSLGMLARLASVHDQGPWFYRQLFWECGLIGQVLYLEAEAAGARGTGIGCFYDDPVHQMLGLRDDRWQSLYHFAMGLPVDDGRLTTEPGYAWETTAGPSR